MLEEQLKKASKEASNQRLWSSLKIGGFVIGTAVLLVSATWAWQHFSTSQDQIVVDDPATPSVVQKEADRENFKEALKTFEAEVEPLVNTDPFAIWNGDAQHQVFSTKDKAISLFSSGDYALALSELEAATRLALSELQAMDDAYSHAMEIAQEQFSQDLHGPAKIEITKALMIRPNEQAALALEAKIDALPRVLELVNNANIAKAENDLRSEAKNLSLILALAPDRSAVKARLEFVSQQINEEDFSSHISAGLQSVAAENLSSARRSLNSAKEIFPQRDEVLLLSKEVHELSKVLKVRSLLRQATKAAQNDDWATASKHYNEARSIEANNADAVSGGEMAEAILTLSSRIDAHLRNAHRLGSPAVVADVNTILDQAQSYIHKSLSLSQKREMLEVKLQAYGTKVPVLILSDNETNILVRGVGKVGQTKERYIQLKPGSYTFEGLRPGYKSRLVKVSIEPNTTDTVVEIVCNEQL